MFYDVEAFNTSSLNVQLVHLLIQSSHLPPHWPWMADTDRFCSVSRFLFSYQRLFWFFNVHLFCTGRSGRESLPSDWSTAGNLKASNWKEGISFFNEWVNECLVNKTGWQFYLVLLSSFGNIHVCVCVYMNIFMYVCYNYVCMRISILI